MNSGWRCAGKGKTHAGAAQLVGSSGKLRQQSLARPRCETVGDVDHFPQSQKIRDTGNARTFARRGSNNCCQAGSIGRRRIG